MIDKEAKRFLSESRASKPLLSHIYLNVYDNYILPGESKKIDKSLVYTFGFYWIKYKPNKPFVTKTKLFSMNVDLMTEYNKFIRVTGYEGLVEWAKTEPRLAWLLRNTNICKEMFDLAKRNPFVPIPFSIKILDYYKMLENKYILDNNCEPSFGLLADPMLSAAEELRWQIFNEDQRELAKLEREHRRAKK